MRVDLPGVGRNLQDRYEIGVVNRHGAALGASLDGARFERGDPLYRRMARPAHGHVCLERRGARADRAARSPSSPLPDLFCMALLAQFDGYFPGYSREIAATARLPHLGRS